MGQAALDLPDPLTDKPAMQPAKADDLLAQLAGEEIDRLLAEAEVDRANAPASTLIQPEPIPSESSGSAEQASPTLQVEAASAEPSSAADPAAQLSPPDAQTVAELVIPPQPPVAASADDPSTASLDTEATSTSELKALNPAVLASFTGDALPLEDAPSDQRIPFYLLPLAWLNAPVAALPEVARDAVGKFAIFLLGAALSLLLYVLVSQR